VGALLLMFVIGGLKAWQSRDGHSVFPQPPPPLSRLSFIVRTIKIAFDRILGMSHEDPDLRR
jgi:hypothetical protein